LLVVAMLAAPAAQLPARGPGFEVPLTWRVRGLSWGTRPLVELIQRAAQRVAHEQPGAVLYVADLSRQDGAPTEWHRSHRAGRDADLLFFARDENGEPAPAPIQMVRFDRWGVAWTLAGRRFFDTGRNWLLVRALLEDRSAIVQRIFIAEPLKERLIDWARSHGEPDALIAHADAVLGQPSDSTAHDDHMHVRVAGGWEVHRVARSRIHRRHQKVRRLQRSGLRVAAG
jgi:penicillin-insensitive murein endopeptidase